MKSNNGIDLKGGQRATMDGGSSDDWEGVILLRDGDLFFYYIGDGDEVKITEELADEIEVTNE